MRPHGRRASVNSGNPEAFAQCDRCGFAGIIYIAKNNISGKCYVGSTIRTLGQRRYRHIQDANHGSVGRLHKAIRKYGIAVFEWTVLEQVASLDQLNERERYWIHKLKPAYNVDLMLDGWRRTTEALQKLSKSARKQMLENPEHWKKYGALGSQSMRRPIINSLTGAVYKTKRAAEAALCERLGVPKRRIGLILLGGVTSDHRELQLRYMDESECLQHGFRYNPVTKYKWSEARKRKFKALKQGQCKPIVCLDDGMHFASIARAAAYYGFTASPRELSNAHIDIKNGWRWKGRRFEYYLREAA